MSTAVENELQTTALTWKAQAQAIQVTNQATYDQAVEMLKGIKDLRGKAEQHHRPGIEAAYKSHKVAVATLKSIDDPLVEAEGILKQSVGAYTLEQQRIQREAQRIAEENARKRQEEERLAVAVAVEQAGATPEQVTAVLDEPLPLPMPTVAPVYERAAGVATRETYAAEVFDLKVLCAEIGAGRQPVQYVSGNMVALNGVARAQRTAMSIPGVRLVSSSSVSVRK